MVFGGAVNRKTDAGCLLKVTVARAPGLIVPLSKAGLLFAVAVCAV